MYIERTEHLIRNLINRSAVIDNLAALGINWDMVCASLDTIEDARLAIDSFKSVSSSDEGEAYLRLYGVFQAAFLHQDALVNLAEGLNLSLVNIWTNNHMKELRVIRTKYFGHPTKKTDKKQRNVTYHGIARYSVGSSIVVGWSYPIFQTEKIEVVKLINNYMESADITLKQIEKEFSTKINN